MDREKIENILIEIGVPCGINGFTYIADAIEIFDEKGTDISITKELYPAVAEKNNTTPPRVERAIRHAFGIVRSYKGDPEKIEYYISFANCTNSSSLSMLYKRIKQECEANRGKGTSMIERKAKLDPIIVLQIREIFKQELEKIITEIAETLKDDTETKRRRKHGL